MTRLFCGHKSTCCGAHRVMNNPCILHVCCHIFSLMGEKPCKAGTRIAISSLRPTTTLTMKRNQIFHLAAQMLGNALFGPQHPLQKETLMAIGSMVRFKKRRRKLRA